MFSLRTKTTNLVNFIKESTQLVNQKYSNILVKFNKKVEGTVVENWVKYWKTVCKDYKDVAVDLKNDMKTKPAKSVLVLSGLGFTTFCAYHNPDENHFKNTFIKASNDVILIHPRMQRQETIEHLTFIEKAYNRNILRHLNLGLFSFIWIDNFSKDCHLFEAHCPYLQLEYSTFPGRIIDFGFLNTWWVLAKKMTDYDINY
ncbi:Translocase of the Inner Mitochondrial membrane 29 [Popillia japonica]|uniref:Translocase of the Inner Mitochondrial membrane 29 n=1 Tax=Popillia japonica TaxID=7064 RepID=A0AAW1JBR6_POPJA